MVRFGPFDEKQAGEYQLITNFADETGEVRTLLRIITIEAEENGSEEELVEPVDDDSGSSEEDKEQEPEIAPWIEPTESTFRVRQGYDAVFQLDGAIGADMRLIGVLGPPHFTKSSIAERLLMIFGEKEMIEVGTYPVYLLLQEEGESSKISQVKIRIKVIKPSQTKETEKEEKDKDGDDDADDRVIDNDKDGDVELNKLPKEIEVLAEKISPEDLKVILDRQSVSNDRKQAYFNQVIEIKHEALVEDF